MDHHLSTFIFSFPTILTLIRLIISPILMPLLLLYSGKYRYYYRLAAASAFFILGTTDLLDGYLARKYEQTSFLGSIVDPIADKVLITTTALTLTTLQQIPLFWTMIIITREFLVMGLRELAAYEQRKISVSRSGKIKTFLQMLTLETALLIPCFSTYLLRYTYQVSLYGSLCFTLISGISYFLFYLNKL